LDEKRPAEIHHRHRQYQEQRQDEGELDQGGAPLPVLAFECHGHPFIGTHVLTHEATAQPAKMARAKGKRIPVVTKKAGLWRWNDQIRANPVLRTAAPSAFRRSATPAAITPPAISEASKAITACGYASQAPIAAISFTSPAPIQRNSHPGIS